MQSNAQQTARVGLFFLLGIALIWVAFETLSDGKVFKNKGYNLVAGFENIKELKNGDEVRMAGVKIGAVEQTRLAGRRAEAVLRIDPGVIIQGDAIATVLSAGLLGTNYIGVDLGTRGAAPLVPGAEIRTKVTADMNTIMSQIGDLGSKLDGALSTITEAMKGKDGEPGLFQKLDKLVGKNSRNVAESVTNIKDATAKLNRSEGTLGKLINDPKMHDDLLAAVGEIKSAAADAKTFAANAQGIVDQVKSGKGALGALLYNEQSSQDLKVSVQNLRAVSDKLARGEGTLGKLINDDSLYADVKGTLKKADRMIDRLADQGPITAVGLVANSLF
ncbi:MAG: MCE family protein [Opitutaceae bacterium]|nr:MCE family protein [Opitutaceae bacterium]